MKAQVRVITAADVRDETQVVVVYLAPARSSSASSPAISAHGRFVVFYG